jgi:hypothetical protein
MRSPFTPAFRRQQTKDVAQRDEAETVAFWPDKAS